MQYILLLNNIFKTAAPLPLDISQKFKMAKKHNYVQVTNDQRKELIRLIYQEGMTIKKASKETGIPYPNAKSVN